MWPSKISNGPQKILKGPNMALEISDLGITLQFIFMPEDKYPVCNMCLSGKETTVKKGKENAKRID